MAAVRFEQAGGGIDVIVAANIQSVKVTISFDWNDDPNTNGQAITEVALDGEGNTIKLRTNGDERPNNGAISDSTTLISSPGAERKYNLQLSGNKYLISASNDTLKYDDDSNRDDVNATIRMTVGTPTYYPPGTPVDPVVPEQPTDGGTVTPPPVSCSPPTPWNPAVPDSCPSKPPEPSPGTTGLLISRQGDNTVVLNMRNFVDKLVTLKLTHQTSALWTQTFQFSVPQCSDISPDTGGSPYSKSDYSNSGILGTNEFVFYNVDGGDHQFYFTHGYILPSDKPKRTNYRKETQGDPPVEVCVPFTETYSGPWPPCKPEVAIISDGGNTVRWQFHDGNGSFTAQQVTLQVVSVKNAIPSKGTICNSLLRSNVWVPDPESSGSIGRCLSDYLDHSEPIRFRLPTAAASKTFSGEICYSDFRGVAGAVPPTTPGGSSSNQYGVLHLTNDDFLRQIDLTTNNSIVVTPQNITDTYVSTFGEATPTSNPNLGTTSRRYYSVQLTDGTIVDDTVSNIDIVVSQNQTSGGLNVDDIVTFKKTKVNGNTFNVWFYTSFQQPEQLTNDFLHIFDDNTNTTDTVNSKLVVQGVMTVEPQSITDPGIGDPSYATLNADNKKHYLITFLDSTIIEANAANINIYDRAFLTAAGASRYISVSKKQKLTDKTMKVWFTAYDGNQAEGSQFENTFVRLWAVDRFRNVNYSGNVFPRSWYVNPKLS